MRYKRKTKQNRKKLSNVLSCRKNGMCTRKNKRQKSK